MGSLCHKDANSNEVKNPRGVVTSTATPADQQVLVQVQCPRCKTTLMTMSGSPFMCPCGQRLAAPDVPRPAVVEAQSVAAPSNGGYHAQGDDYRQNWQQQQQRAFLRQSWEAEQQQAWEREELLRQQKLQWSQEDMHRSYRQQRTNSQEGPYVSQPASDSPQQGSAPLGQSAPHEGQNSTRWGDENAHRGTHEGQHQVLVSAAELHERSTERWNRFEINPPERITMSLVPFPTPEELQASMSHLGEKKAFQKLALRWHPDKFLQKFSAGLQEENKKQIIDRVKETFQAVKDAAHQ